MKFHLRINLKENSGWYFAKWKLYNGDLCPIHEVDLWGEKPLNGDNNFKKSPFILMSLFVAAQF